VVKLVSDLRGKVFERARRERPPSIAPTAPLLVRTYPTPNIGAIDTGSFPVLTDKIR